MKIRRIQSLILFLIFSLSAGCGQYSRDIDNKDNIINNAKTNITGKADTTDTFDIDDKSDTVNTADTSDAAGTSDTADTIDTADTSNTTHTSDSLDTRIDDINSACTEEDTAIVDQPDAISVIMSQEDYSGKSSQLLYDVDIYYPESTRILDYKGNGPTGFYVANNGMIYICSSVNNEILVYDEKQELSKRVKLKSDYLPQDIYFDDNTETFYVLTDNSLCKLDTDFNLIGEYLIPSEIIGQELDTYPSIISRTADGLAIIYSDGDLYLAEADGSLKMTPEKSQLSQEYTAAIDGNQAYIERKSTGERFFINNTEEDIVEKVDLLFRDMKGNIFINLQYREYYNYIPSILHRIYIFNPSGNILSEYYYKCADYTPGSGTIVSFKLINGCMYQMSADDWEGIRINMLKAATKVTEVHYSNSPEFIRLFIPDETNSELILHVPSGNKADNISYDYVIEQETFGPESFYITKDSIIYLCDTVNYRILVFKDKQMVFEIKLPSEYKIIDVFVSENGKILLLEEHYDGSSLLVLSKAGAIESKEDIPEIKENEISEGSGTYIKPSNIRIIDGNIIIMFKNDHYYIFKDGRLEPTYLYGYTGRLNGAEPYIKKVGANQRLYQEVSGDPIEINVLHKDQNQRLYVKVAEFYQDEESMDFALEESIRIWKDGMLENTVFLLDNDGFVSPNKKIVIQDDGSIYQMLTNYDGVYIYKLKLSSLDQSKIKQFMNK